MLFFPTLNVNFFDFQLEFTAACGLADYQSENPLGSMDSRLNGLSQAHLNIGRGC
jgi:hypothetical protein